ncbi:MAG: protein lplB [Bacilli bacterium]|nr:protein lplB [Bacilli bacterium]
MDATMAVKPTTAVKTKPKRNVRNRILKNRYIYLMILPGLIYFVLFKYIPMVGLAISFEDFQPYRGMFGGPWVGFEYFHQLFTDPAFWMILKNTLILFGLNLLIFFPIPIVLALMLNEIKVQFFKRSVQTIIYIPYFMSWVIVVSITYVLLTTDDGIINGILVELGHQKINFLLSTSWFRPIYVLQNIWQGAGWGTIIYLAAITSIDPGLYEAAKMDGASRLRQIWHITLPAIRSVIVILLILKIGQVLDLGYEHVYLMLNSMNRSVAEIIDTYVYTAGLQEGQWSYSTAIGFFKSLIGLILVMGANWLAKKVGEEGVY